ncbi:MAG: flagellar basal body L-ring protein FlgH [Nitrospirota bacterium]|nr:flagellar basal body L-ring protein FlgH [Nitrospirota bacterium]MDE3223844.1 flagellar basal body L-ring protein FlgH [Nitrospirota bacterium]MDE3241100.1 flagellar basal body L-ring protein FlgH [Nitrospirota bacterium]
MNWQRGSAVVVAAGLLAGCTSPPPIISQIVIPPLPPPKTIGSLWQEENGRAYLYEDLRAMRIGDILTIKIQESHQGSKSADTSAERDSSLNDSLTGNTIGLPAMVLNKFQANSLGVNANAQHKFSGKGATNRADTLTGTMSAHVTQVMPNGDLRIEGRREVTVNSEKQTLKISGVVRRVDVDTKNQVLSTAIADARIEYTGLGVVDDVQRPGWFTRVLDWIYPF